MRRSLSLRRETLAELTAPELAAVAGAASVPVPNTVKVRECLDDISGHTCLDCLTRSGC